MSELRLKIQAVEIFDDFIRFEGRKYFPEPAPLPESDVICKLKDMQEKLSTACPGTVVNTAILSLLIDILIEAEREKESR